MIPNVNDIIYFIFDHKVNILEVTEVYEVQYQLADRIVKDSPSHYRISFLKRLGDYPLDFIVINSSELLSKDKIIPIGRGHYLIFDEETFLNYIKTHEIT